MARLSTSVSGNGSLVAEVSAAAAAQELTVPGLDGDRDGRYYVEGVIHIPASVPVSHYWRPNSLTTNQQSQRSTSLGAYAATTADLNFSIANVAGPVRMELQAWINAARTVGGVATWRTFLTHAVVHFNVSAWSVDYWSIGSWQETATNLTSLVLRASTATGILAGSVLQVYRASRKFPL